MDTRFLLDTRRRARGATKPTFIAIIAVFVLLAIGAWFLIFKPHEELIMADSGGHPSTPITRTKAAAPPVNVAGMDVDQLISEARAAMSQQRYLAPAGNNAFEFYLRVLEKDPGNKVASDALRETFPFAANSAEQAINTRDFNEAQREIDLLAKADPTNFTLTILRSKLDAQRKTLDQQQQQALDQQKAATVAAEKAATDKAAAEQVAQQQEQLAEQQKAKQEAAAAETRKVAAANPAESANGSPGNITTAPAGPTTGAVLIKAPSPNYPSTAVRSHQQGWVVVSFKIDTDGRTSDLKVVDSQPRRVFDRAAMEAVGRYRFTPAMKDGVAIASTKQQRIEFKL